MNELLFYTHCVRNVPPLVYIWVYIHIVYVCFVRYPIITELL